MEARLLLCDYAEALNGKLYIIGGGWSSVTTSGLTTMSIAVHLATPWNQANQKHRLQLSLFGEDGQEPITGPDGNPVQIEGEFEVGRPPGTVAGDDLVNTMTFRMEGLDLSSGGYRVEFSIDGTQLDRVPFRVTRVEVPNL